MIFVDTSAWFAVYHAADRNHGSARLWFKANRAPLLTTDYVIDETLTLLRARGRPGMDRQFGEDLFGGSLAVVHYLTEDEIREAWTVFHGFSDKEWSFTDCTSRIVLKTLGITRAFVFDHHFRQFGMKLEIVS